MKHYTRSLFPPLVTDHSTLALRPLFIGGMVTPVEGGDAGVNIDMVSDNPAGLLSAVDPWQRMQAGDHVDVYWEDSVVASADVAESGVDKRVYVYLPTAPIVPDWAEPVFYRLTRAAGGTPEDAAPLRLRVKLDRPAGLDKDPHLPGHSELAAPQLPQDVIDNGADAAWAERGVPVTIAPYPGRAARDTLHLMWGHVSLLRRISEAEAAGNDPVVITVDQATILAAGDAPNLLVQYQVFDEVFNFSEDWSLRTFVKVEAGAWRLEAPIIEDAVDGVIDLAVLGSKDVNVQTRIISPDFALGDRITLTWTGTPASGAPLILKDTFTVDDVPSIHMTRVPNADIRALINGRGEASYVLTKANGDPPQSSKRAIARIEGEALLPAPTILELIGDTLPADLRRANVEIPAYDGMANGDLIDLIWLGTLANGTPYLYEAQHTVTEGEKGNVVYFPVVDEHIALLENGTLDVSYRVSNGAWQMQGVRVSDHLRVRVGQFISTLPAPTVIEAPDNVLDPELHPGAVTLNVNYLGTVAGDIVTWYWIGPDPEGSASDGIPITIALAGKPLNFTIPRSLIEPNINEQVRALYTLRSGATGELRYSAVLELTIGRLIGELPPPDVLQARNGVLDPLDALTGATVRVAYETMEPDDQITLVWIGAPGTGSPDDQQQNGSSTGQVEFSVPAAVIGANIGRDVMVYYRVKRYTAERMSSILKLNILPFGNPEKDLPHPAITQAIGDVLNLATFSGNAQATLAKWPFIATGQRVWFRLEGANENGGPVSIVLLDGAALTAAQASAGLSESVLRRELETLGQDTTLTVVCNVAFDGIPSETNAVPFPRTRYTFKLHHDWVEPVIVSVRDSQGEVPEGGSTYDNTLTIRGTSTLEADLELLDGMVRLTTLQANGEGAWAVTLSTLDAKVYSVRAHALDGSDLISQPRTFEVLENVQPVIERVQDSRGPVANGGTTVDTSVQVSGRASFNRSIELFDGNLSKGTANSDASGNWSLYVTGLTVAPHPFKARALYGTHPESDIWTVIVTQSVAPTITSVRDSSNVEIAHQGFTVDTRVTLVGRATATFDVEIYNGNASLGIVTTDPSGQWTLSLNGLALATYSIKAKALYGAGAESAVRTFTVTAVVAPVITSVRDPAGNAVANGGSTYANRVTAQGSASLGQAVELLDNGVSRGTTRANASGQWSVDVSTLSVGNHSLTAKGLYANNPVSAAWTFEAKASAAPSITSIRDSKGEVANGGTTTDTSVLVAGSAVANERVEVTDNGTVKGTASVNGSGNWSLNISGLALGNHRIKAVALYGNGAESNVRGFTVASPVPPFVLDPSPVTLGGKVYLIYGNRGLSPVYWPAGTTVTRRPSSGSPPYTYSSSNTRTAVVDASGLVKAQSNGSAVITVRDSQGQSGSYTVNVSGVIECRYFDKHIYNSAKSVIQGAGYRVPNLAELHEMGELYFKIWPFAYTDYWSSDPGWLIFTQKTLNIYDNNSTFSPIAIKYSYGAVGIVRT